MLAIVLGVVGRDAAADKKCAVRVGIFSAASSGVLLNTLVQLLVLHCDVVGYADSR